MRAARLPRRHVAGAVGLTTSADDAPVLTIACDADEVSEEARHDFEQLCTLIHGAYQRLANHAGMPRRTEVLLTANLAFTVRSRAQSLADTSFDASRPGESLVAAKNLPQDVNHDHVVIVFDARLWMSAEARGGVERAREIHLIAHELAHPALAPLRIASGGAYGSSPPYTPGEVARAIGRVLMDEYRADRLADLVLGATATKATDVGAEPASEWGYDGPSRIANLRDLLVLAQAEFPGLVDLYRTGRIDLVAMWDEVQKWTSHLLTMYVHCRAAADASQTDVPILDAEPIAALPFVRLYLADTVPPLIAALRLGALLPSPVEWSDVDRQVAVVAETSMREIWRRIGLTFVELPNSAPSAST